MKRRVAHGMRRVARVLITRANKLDPPNTEWLNEHLAPWQRRLVEQAVANGQVASKGAARRKLGLAADVIEIDGRPWQDRIRKGLADARPGLPNR